MNSAQKSILAMIDTGLISLEPDNAIQLKDFAIACFSASLLNNSGGHKESKDYLKSFVMERSKLAAVNKVKTDGVKMVFTSRIVDCLVTRKYFIDFSIKLKKHPKALASIVLLELESEGALEFSANRKRVSIK
jgi:hypothetical protein